MLLEATHRIFFGLLDDHVWITEFTLVIQENTILELLGYDIKALCVLQCCLLWFSAPTAANVALGGPQSAGETLPGCLTKLWRASSSSSSQSSQE